MRRALATTALLLVLSAAAIVPGAGAQVIEDLVTCSFSPSELTLRPGESAAFEVTSDPASAAAIIQFSFNGSDAGGGRTTVESGTTSPVSYESTVEEIQLLTGEVVTSGVFVLYLGVTVIVGEEVEQFDPRCSISFTLTEEPDPTTTTVAPEPEPDPSPEAEPATPRFTG